MMIEREEEKIQMNQLDNQNSIKILQSSLINFPEFFNKICTNINMSKKMCKLQTFYEFTLKYFNKEWKFF